MKKLIALLFLLSFYFFSKASVNYWIGSEQPEWSNASNWANGVPAVTDTVFFDGVVATVIVDVNPNIAGLQVINNSDVIFSSGNTTLVTIGNLNTSGQLVFFVAAGSSFTLQGTVIAKGVSIQTYGNFTTTNAVVDGTFIFGDYSCTWNVNSFPASFCTTNISGKVKVTANNSGSVMSGGISNGNAGTINFLNGSVLDWQRSGGSAPNANFANGSLILVTGITGTNMNFNSSARYDGLLIWDCGTQTVSGSAALLLPATNITMDSVRINNTGSGSVRFATNPNGYTINSLEINGGTLELSAPNSNTNNLTDTIAGDFKITGGTVYGNATFNFDNFGSAYPNTLIVRGSLIMTGGVLDFTNRTSGNSPGGSFSMFVKGNVSQTAGRIKATKGFDAQNLLVLNGTSQQNVRLSNITDTISLVIDNAAGASLQDNINLPYKMQLKKGYLQLNQYNAAIAAARISQAVVLPVPCVVTNGSGKLVITGVTGSQLFPIGPFANGYNPVTINNSDAVAKTYRAVVSYGIAPTGNIDISKAINRTWNIGAAVPVTNETTSFIFQYADTEKVVSATVNPAAAMVLAHYTSQWSYDPYALVVPAGTPAAYIAGPFVPLSLDSSFVIGNTGLISNTYIFTGTGDWATPSNWANNTVPPNPLPAGKEIIIDPASGDCILNISQTISPSAKITVNKNKSFLIRGNLTVQ